MSVDSHIDVVFPSAHRRGGVERVTWDLLSHLSPSVTASFIGTRAPDGLPEGVEHVAVPAGAPLPASLGPVRFRRAAARVLRGRPGGACVVSMGVECPPGDVLWVHSVHQAWLRTNAPVHVRGISVPGAARWVMPKHLAYLALERQYFLQARPRRVLCTSRHEAELLHDLYGVDTGLINVVPNGYDPALFHPGRRLDEREVARDLFQAGPDDIVLLLVANEFHRKGLAQLLHALPICNDPRLRLHVVGAGDPAPFADLAAQLGLTQRVRFHGQTLDIGHFMAGADLLVLPTQYEPFGLVVIEALATGLPVLTTRLAGASTAVEHGTNGLLQEDPFDVEELASLLTEAARADLTRWSAAAAACVESYRKDRVMERAARLITDAPEPPRAVPPASG